MKNKKETEEEIKEVTFEKSFKRLEEILNELENKTEDFALEDMIKNYQEGLQLLKICRSKLQEAELKIEKISTEEEN